jgi:MFS family permease
MNSNQRVLGACCSAHVLHDGYSDLLYVLFPIWQNAFGLSLAEVGVLKTIYSGSLASFQVPASILADAIGIKVLLLIGTFFAALGFLLSGWTGGFIGLIICLIISGIGASVQHPLSSSLISHAFEESKLRAALSTYNFSGDVGKVLLPSVCAALLAVFDWHLVTSLMGVLGLIATFVLWLLLPKEPASKAPIKSERVEGAHLSQSADNSIFQILNPGFLSLSIIGIIDSATRMGFLTLLPFLLISKGATLTQVGFALSLTFAGGATGKFICGFVANKIGVIRTTVVTEIATCLLILSTLPLSVDMMMILLPLVGVALNGTSSGLYGTVPELVPSNARSRAFGIFYTLTIGAGAVSPLIFGFVGDFLGVQHTLKIIAALVLLVLPVTRILKQKLGDYS